MGRFYFDIHDGQGYSSDADGIEYASVEEAGSEALKILPHLAIECLVPETIYSVKVRDERGQYVFEASLKMHTAWIG